MNYKRKFILKLLIIVFINIIAFAFSSGQNAQADEGIGITGSFSTFDYKIVQGETIDTPLVNVIFVNQYDHAISLQLYEDVPDGISLNIGEQIITIEANSRTDIPIVISAAEDTIPGEYEIYIKGKLILDLVEGKINLAPEYALHTTVTVFGEAADLDIDIVDEVGEPIRAVMNLYQVADGFRTPIDYSENGTLKERVIPGEYEIFAFWDDYQLANYKFTVSDGEQFQKTLTASTVQIYGFFATPVFVENSKNELATANIKFVLHNIYKELNNARVVLVVYKNDELLEKKDVFLYDNLEVNRHDMGFNYVPSQGWDKAEYRFLIEFYVDEHDEEGNIIKSTLYATSLPADLDVSGLSFKKLSQFFSERLLLIIILAVLIVGIFFLLKYITKRLKNPGSVPSDAPALKAVPKNKCPDCQGEGKILCPACNGKGKTLYQSIEEDCLYCDGVGEVMCGTCVNPKHLITCPRCKGDKFVVSDGVNTECTYCNGLGHVVDRQHTIYVNGVKMKLGKKNK